MFYEFSLNFVAAAVKLDDQLGLGEQGRMDIPIPFTVRLSFLTPLPRFCNRPNPSSQRRLRGGEMGLARWC